MPKTNPERQVAHRKRGQAARRAIPELTQIAEQGVQMCERAIEHAEPEVQAIWREARRQFIEALEAASVVESAPIAKLAND